MHVRRPAFTVSCTLGFVLLSLLHSEAAPLVFEKDIRPILKTHCFDCHGEGEKLKGGLDLRLRRLMIKGGDDGPVLVPGKPDKSAIYKMVHSGEMPRRDKKLTPQQVEVIKQWIASGAKTAREEPTTLGKGSGITEEERAFWSFQPVRKPAIPKTKPKDRVRTPIDAFLVEALAKQKLMFSADAGKITLLRRAYFDLTGLPPTPVDVDAFLSDSAPDAYERLIDRLLESPHYGERWGRHWLDVAGYADSDGYSDADPPRPYAYKFRDYVVRSFNADKPFDQFVIEQLAGDEMARVSQTNAQSVVADPQLREFLVATGFLRMGADGSATPAVDNHDTVRNQVVADTIKIVSTSLLGLTMGCAQCHDHRYDPIPQTDYYRLRAVIEPAYDWKNWRNPDQRLISLYTDADRKRAAEVETEAQKLAAEKNAKQKQYIDEALNQTSRRNTNPACANNSAPHTTTPADKRSAEQKKLLADNPEREHQPRRALSVQPEGGGRFKAMDAKIGEIRARKPTEDFISVLTEPAGQDPGDLSFSSGRSETAERSRRTWGADGACAARASHSFAGERSESPTQRPAAGFRAMAHQRHESTGCPGAGEPRFGCTISAAALSARRRTSAQWASGLQIPNCSTGWRAILSSMAGR